MTQQVYGIFGWPVAHSRSPVMHNAAFQALKLNACYLPFEVHPDRLQQAIEAIGALGLGGINLTVPHKQTAMAWLNQIDPAAQAIGAVNVVTLQNDKLVGTNTDAPGLIAALHEQQIEIHNRSVTVLGTGGAARAAIVGLKQAGASEIVLVARNLDAASKLRDEFADSGTTVLSRRLEDGLLPDTQLAVNSTSATLHHDDQARVFVEGLGLDALTDATIMDMAYGLEPTMLVKKAREHGLQAFDGLGMLLHQGALAFEIWTEQQPPLEIMRKALHDDLGRST